MAEGLMRHLAEKRGINIELDSCGTSAYHKGEAPDERAQATMLSKGIDIGSLRARQLTPSDFDHFDHILVMDQSNYNNTISIARNETDENKVKLLLQFATNHSERNVPDPYFGGDEGFEHVYALLEDACNSFLDEIKCKRERCI